MVEYLIHGAVRLADDCVQKLHTTETARLAVPRQSIYYQEYLGCLPE